MTRKRKQQHRRRPVSHGEEMSIIDRAFAQNQHLPQPTGVSDPRRLGGSITGPGGPHDRGAVLLDTTDVILMDSLDVCTVDQVRAGESAGQAIFLTIDGRINNRTDRARAGVLVGPDGAASIISALLAVADRFGPELLTDLTRRLVDLDADGNTSLGWLRAALDLAEEARRG